MIYQFILLSNNLQLCLQDGSSLCPLRRAGSLPVYSPNDPRILLTDFKDYNNKNNSESIEKIKREYHIKDEDIDSKDFKIKAERGHHDKISLGLFPSDVKVKSEESSLLLKSKAVTGSVTGSSSVSVSSIKSEAMIKNEIETNNSSNSNSNINNNSDSKSKSNIAIKNEKKSIKSEVAIITPSSKETVKLSVAPRRNERRSRSTAQMDTDTDVDKDAVGDDKDEDIVLLKRRGNIIR